MSRKVSRTASVGQQRPDNPVSIVTPRITPVLSSRSRRDIRAPLPSETITSILDHGCCKTAAFSARRSRKKTARFCVQVERPHDLVVVYNSGEEVGCAALPPRTV